MFSCTNIKQFYVCNFQMGAPLKLNHRYQSTRIIIVSLLKALLDIIYKYIYLYTREPAVPNIVLLSELLTLRFDFYIQKTFSECYTLLHLQKKLQATLIRSMYLFILFSYVNISDSISPSGREFYVFVWMENDTILYIAIHLFYVNSKEQQNPSCST